MSELAVKVTLTVIEGEDYQKTIQMTQPVLTIGRKNTPFNLNDVKISSQHAKVEIRGKDVFIVDLNSRNGTIVNGTAVSRSLLKDLDVVELGFTKIQINIVENLQAFKKTQFQDAQTQVQKDISSLIDDELEKFSKWDLSSPSLSKQKVDQDTLPFGLEIKKGPDKGKKYIFPKSKIILGRGNVDCLLRDQDVSRMHAMIEVDGNGIMTIKDLNSTNGMMINGKKEVEAELVPGDVVQMGQTVFVIVSLKD